MSQAGDISGGGKNSLKTLSGENVIKRAPLAGNFNFSGTVGGGYGTNGAIVFSTPSNGEMNAQVQVDGATVIINAANKLQSISQFTWVVQAADLIASPGFGYFANSATPGPIGLIVTLPAASTVGQTFRVYAYNSNGWTIAQGAGQSIQVGQQTTTVGATGSLVSTRTGDTVELVCTATNTTWAAVSYDGNIIII